MATILFILGTISWLFLIRRYIGLHTQGLKVSIFYFRVRVRYRSFVFSQPLDGDVEQFLSMLKFESKGKLEDLGLEIYTTTPKSGG